MKDSSLPMCQHLLSEGHLLLRREVSRDFKVRVWRRRSWLSSLSLPFIAGLWWLSSANNGQVTAREHLLSGRLSLLPPCQQGYCGHCCRLLCPLWRYHSNRSQAYHRTLSKGQWGGKGVAMSVAMVIFSLLPALSHCLCCPDGLPCLCAVGWPQLCQSGRPREMTIHFLDSTFMHPPSSPPPPPPPPLS